jgi:hypothetical protein
MISLPRADAHKLGRTAEAKNCIGASAGDRRRNVERMQNIMSKQKASVDSHFIKACQAVVIFGATRLADLVGCGYRDAVEFSAEIWPNGDDKLT